MIHLATLWATQRVALNSVFISEERTGKDVEGIEQITIVNNTSVSTLTPRSKKICTFINSSDVWADIWTQVI